MSLPAREQSRLARPWGGFGVVARVLAPVAVLAVGVGIFFALGGRKPPERQRGAADTIGQLRTVAVVPHQAELTIHADGQVRPFREIDVAAEVGGRVRFKGLKDKDGNGAGDWKAGDYVRADTLLMEIDPADYEFEVSRLTAEVKQAQAMLEEQLETIANNQSQLEVAKEQLRFDQIEMSRQQSLFDRNMIPERELERVKKTLLQTQQVVTDLESRARSLEVGEERLEAAQQRAETLLEKARLDLARTKIYAPVDGVITEDPVEQGAFVQKGMALFSIEDTSRAEVECRLRMKDLYWIWDQVERSPGELQQARTEQAYELPPTPVTVVYELAGGEYTWEGELSRYDGLGLDERTRTAPVRVTVSDPRDVSVRTLSGELRAGPPALVRGMFVSLEIHARPRQQLLRIPESALKPGNRVWRVVPLKGPTEEGRADPSEANGQIEIIDVKVASAIPRSVLKRNVLVDDALAGQVFQEGAFTPEVRARLIRDPYLSQTDLNTLISPRVFRRPELRDDALESAILIRPAPGDFLEAGDRVAIAGLPGARQGLPVEEVRVDEEAERPQR